MTDLKDDFLKEYEALCRKYGLFVSPGPHTDDLAHLRSIKMPEGVGIDPEFLFTLHLDELRRADINHYGDEF